MLDSTNRSDYIEYLNKSLNEINDELKNSIDYELLSLKEEEKIIQDALQYKTRKTLINSIEKDLELDNLKANLNKSINNLNLSSSFTNDQISTLDSSLKNSKLMTNFSNSNDQSNILNSYNNLYQTYLAKTNDYLKSKTFASSHLEMHSSSDECPICSSKDINSLINSKDNLRENLSTYLSNSVQIKPNFTNSYLKKEIIRPNVIYSSKSLSNNRPTQNFRTKTQMHTPIIQDTGKLSLTYDGNLDGRNLMSSSSFQKSQRPLSVPTHVNLNAKAEFERGYAAALRDSKYFRTHKTLPETKSMYNERPWVPGKVETNYYSFRDSKLNRK